MSWRIYGERLETADMLGIPRVYQPFTLAKKRVIKAIRTWVIYFNDPVFTTLVLKIYSNKNGLPAQVIHTSSKAWTPSEVSSKAYAAKELYFDFDNPLSFHADTYHAVLYASGYTGNSDSHLAWRRTSPDPNNGIDIAIETADFGSVPFYLGIIDGLL